MARPFDKDFKEALKNFKVPSSPGGTLPYITANNGEVIFDAMKLREMARSWNVSMAMDEPARVEFEVLWRREYIKDNDLYREQGILYGEGYLVEDNRQVQLIKYKLELDRPLDYRGIGAGIVDTRRYERQQKQIQKPLAWMPSDMYNQVVADNEALAKQMGLKIEDAPVNEVAQILSDSIAKATLEALDRRASEVLTGVMSGKDISTGVISNKEINPQISFSGSFEPISGMETFYEEELKGLRNLREEISFEEAEDFRMRRGKWAKQAKKKRQKVSGKDRDLIF